MKVDCSGVCLGSRFFIWYDAFAKPGNKMYLSGKNNLKYTLQYEDLKDYNLSYCGIMLSIVL